MCPTIAPFHLLRRCRRRCCASPAQRTPHRQMCLHHRCRHSWNSHRHPHPCLCRIGPPSVPSQLLRRCRRQCCASPGQRTPHRQMCPHHRCRHSWNSHRHPHPCLCRIGPPGVPSQLLRRCHRQCCDSPAQRTPLQKMCPHPRCRHSWHFHRHPHPCLCRIGPPNVPS